MQMNLINCYYGWNLVFLVSAIHACSWYFTQRNLKRRYLYVTLTFKAIIISFRFSCHDLISIRDHHVLKNFSLVVTLLLFIQQSSLDFFVFRSYTIDDDTSLNLQIKGKKNIQWSTLWTVIPLQWHHEYYFIQSFTNIGT